jgi:hypothetical protein
VSILVNSHLFIAALTYQVNAMRNYHQNADIY